MASNFICRWLAGVFLLVSGAGCAKHLNSAGSSLTYELTRFRRSAPAGAPLLTGAIDQRQADGTRYPPAVASKIQNFSVLAIDGKLFNSRPDGTYAQVLTAGRHCLRVGHPGLVRVDLSLRVRQDDSIRLDFHLRADTTQLIN